MTNDIKNHLNIKDANIQFSSDSVQQQDNKLYIHCSLIDSVHTCPKCQLEGSIVHNGHRASKISYLNPLAKRGILSLINKASYVNNVAIHSLPRHLLLRRTARFQEPQNKK